MRVKLNRGPYKGKVQEFDEPRDVIVVRQMLPIDWANPSPPADPVPAREGTYRRSNVVQKNGTVVYEWMGWYAN